jgi:ribulose-5-phosphate 4-epimerase/fuculose-1-phosphate aldolase
VKPADFLTVDLNGRILAGQGEIELTSLLIHGAMHRELCQARVILHTHQPNINWLTCLEDQTSKCAVNTHSTSPDALHISIASGSPPKPRSGRSSTTRSRIATFSSWPITGSRFCGPAVHEAFDDLYTLDRACQIQSMALASRRPLRTISPGDVAVMFPAARAKAKEEGEMHFPCPSPQSSGARTGARLMPKPCLAVLAGIVLVSSAFAQPAPAIAQPGLKLSADQLKAQVRVTAGRRLHPKSWPNGARVAVALSFDVDNMSTALARGDFVSRCALSR